MKNKNIKEKDKSILKPSSKEKKQKNKDSNSLFFINKLYIAEKNEDAFYKKDIKVKEVNNLMNKEYNNKKSKKFNKNNVNTIKFNRIKKYKYNLFILCLVLILNELVLSFNNISKLRKLNFESKIVVTITTSGKNTFFYKDFTPQPNKIIINNKEIDNKIVTYNFPHSKFEKIYHFL